MRLRLIASGLLLALGCAASAKPEFLEALKRQYMTPRADCNICHTTPPQRHAFGKQVNSVLSGNDIAAALKSVETLDADADGATNLEEIEASTLPGDATSKPGARPSPIPVVSAEPQLIPTHSFHPVIVHFPIALFLFGALLEFLGWRKERSDLRQGGWCCLLGGGVSSIGAVTSGLLFFFRGGFSWEGLALTHFIFAVSATILMLGVCVWRRKGEHTAPGYFALLGLACALVGLAGHFGGMMVFG